MCVMCSHFEQGIDISASSIQKIQLPVKQTLTQISQSTFSKKGSDNYFSQNRLFGLQKHFVLQYTNLPSSNCVMQMERKQVTFSAVCALFIFERGCNIEFKFLFLKI